MKKIISIIIITLITILILSFLSPQTIYLEEFGGNRNDIFNDVIGTSNGNVVAVGNYKSSDIEGFESDPYNNAMIVKYNKTGQILWKKFFGGSSYDTFDSVISTSEGDIVTVGNFESTDIENLQNKGHKDAVIVKYDKNGNELWKKSFGGGGTDLFISAAVTNLDEIVVIGEQSSSIQGLEKNTFSFIIKYDKNGNELWKKSFGNTLNDKLSDITVTKDNGIVVVGYQLIGVDEINNEGIFEYVVVKYDQNGNELWQKRYQDEFYKNVTSTSDNAIIITGQKKQEDRIFYDGVITKIDKKGNEKWTKYFTSLMSSYIDDVIGTNDGGIVIAGYYVPEAETKEFDYDMVLIKYDKYGIRKWIKNFENETEERMKAISTIKNRGIVGVGEIQSKNIENIESNSFIIRFSNLYKYIIVIIIFLLVKSVLIPKKMKR